MLDGQETTDIPKIIRVQVFVEKSESFIVVGGQESCPQGEGVTGPKKIGRKSSDEEKSKPILWDWEVMSPSSTNDIDSISTGTLDSKWSQTLGFISPSS